MHSENKQFQGKRAVVFGGAGFIGSHLMASLLERGYEEVVSADINEPKQPVEGVRYLNCDVRIPVPTDLTNETPDEVYNLAAVHQTPGHAEHEYFETNIPGAVNVCKYCTSLGIEKLIFTSSIAVYGPSEEVKDEKFTPAPVSAYGKSKLEAESIHLAWAEETEAKKLLIIRPAVIFGPGEDGNFTRLAKVIKKRVFFYAGRRDTIKGCGYVKDFVESIFFGLKLNHPICLYNFCYPKPYTIQDICESFSRVGNLPRPLVAIPIPILLGAAGIFELLSLCGLRNNIHRQRVMKLVRSTNIKPAFLLEAEFPFQGNLDDGLKHWKSSSRNGFFV